MAKVVEATRTFSNNLEGHVRAGRRFAVDKPFEDLRVITTARANSLLGNGLLRSYEPDVPLAAAPRPTYAGMPRTTVKQSATTQLRAARPVRQEAAPKAPGPLKNPAGGLTGPAKSASSSVAAPVLPESTLPVRGNRRSPASPSTTPTKSSPGQPLSTPATQTGGVSMKDAQRSEA